MSSFPRVWPFVACVVTGAALYLTRGVLDQVLVDGRAVRIALLPPWESLVGFTACAGVCLVLLQHLGRPRRTTRVRVPLGALVLPALALAVLLVPFLPVVPDRLPVLQTLAGPARGVVWLVVAALLVWTWWQHRLITATWLSRRTIAQAAVMIGLATALVSGAAAARLTGTVLFPAGDEPHYLVIAQSLWRDGDLKIENNHQRGDYREYFRQGLDPHYLTRGSDGEIYSIHPIGLPVLLAPVYAAAGYRGVLWALIAMAALASALAWRWVVDVLHAPGAATFAWAAIATSAPFLFNTFTVYPEIAAALAVMVALTSRHPLVIGIACGILPWLSTKYAPMSLILLVVTVFGPGTTVRAAVPALVKRAIPYGLLLIAWFAFFYAVWGSPWPQAPYGAMVQTTPWNLVFGAPGLLFDQEYGLLPYAPAYILAATGLWVMWRAGGEQRLMALRVVLVFGALLATVGAFRIWWGGSAAPARPLTSGLLVLALPIAAAFAAAPAGSARRAAQHLLLWVGAGIAVTMTLAQEGLLIANGRDGTSSLLEWWSPRWELWTLAPSFIHHEAGTALLHSLAWLAIAAAAGWWLSRSTVRTPGGAALAAFGVAGVGVLTAALLLPLLPSDPPMPRVDLRGRARLAALDRFDTRALPAAVVFDPLEKRSALDVLPALSLEVGPGLRTDSQPVRVIHNGRFSLPAGTYRIDVGFVAGEHTGPVPLSLQLGRTGPPLESWTVDPASGPWSSTIRLPADAGFVGFRGSRELERAIQLIRLTPVSIVDHGRRPRVPAVLAAGRYEGGTVLFHDDQVNLEPDGFWIPGRRQVRFSISPPDEAPGPVALRLRSGASANVITLHTHGWEQTVTLDAEQPQDIVLPAPGRGVIDLTITASEGFVPMDRDPTSRDRRFLGVWVDVIRGPAAQAQAARSRAASDTVEP